jgi:hypothetical protein
MKKASKHRYWSASLGVIMALGLVGAAVPSAATADDKPSADNPANAAADAATKAADAAIKAAEAATKAAEAAATAANAATKAVAEATPKPGTDAAAKTAEPASSQAVDSPSKVADAAPKPPAAMTQPLWSWQPVKAPDVPQVSEKEWVRQPIDAFVLAKIEAQSFKPSPDADRATFIRRATLDTWGLIPTPEEVKAFVNDDSPDAYEKLVDRLLTSPRYGERQARMWLDLARYADTGGFQADEGRPNIWRYRDYVINAFNSDKPYDLFLKEQIAGDELEPGNEQALIATGFMANYPDNPNSRDLIQRKYQITTDIVDTIGQGVLATTWNCARCHNSKFDKLSQKDYYQVQAFFANTSFDAKMPATKGPREQDYEAKLANWKDATKDIRAQIRALIDPVRAEADKYYKERYLTDSREAVFKPQDQWTPVDRWVNFRYAQLVKDEDYAGYFARGGESKDSPDYNEADWNKWLQYRKLSKELRAFDSLKPKGSDTLTGVTELGHPDAPKTYILFGGNHERPTDEVQPGFPEFIANGERPDIHPTATSSGRRLAFANWLASPTNPLTARVFVNRIWNQHFGKGIVATVSDFGRAGDKPTNRELLDYMSARFVADGWSIKKLQREILLSSVYRQSSEPREDVAKVDPDNKLIAVFPRVRLEAEEIRDSLLVASGKLSDKVGGPSVAAPLPAGVAVVQNNFYADTMERAKDADDQYRRSLYIITKRSQPYPLLDVFDMANSQQIHSKRNVTTTPLQALALLNNDVVFNLSQHLAARVLAEAGNDENKEFTRLYQILFARNPDDTELKVLHAFLASHEKTIADKASGGNLTLALPVAWTDSDRPDPIRAAAFVDLVDAVANTNDFIYRF